MSWLWPTERERWRQRLVPERMERHIGLPALDARARALYGEVLPRGVGMARLAPDRPALNQWMPPHQLAQYAWLPGQIILGKFAGRYLGTLDDRPQVTIAGRGPARPRPCWSPISTFIPAPCWCSIPRASCRIRR